MKIDTGAFKILVYPGDHPPPHCHVRWRDGKESLVELPNVFVIAGAKLTDEVKKVIIDHLDELADEFERLNPKKH